MSNCKNVLITGAGGFVGKQLAIALKNRGYNISTLQRGLYRELDELGFNNIKGDITNQKDVDNALINIDAIFHVASKIGMWGDQKEFYNINVNGTKNLLEGAKRKGIKYFIYTSTPSVVFDQGDINGSDESIPYPKKHLNLYGETKRIAEQEVLNAKSEHFFTAAIRPHLIFGPGDRQLIPRVIEAHKQKRLKIIGDGENLVDVSYIDNVVDAHIKLLEKMITDPKSVNGKPYFIGQEKPVKLWEFTNEIMKGVGLAPVTKKVSVKLAYHLGHFIELCFKALGITNIDPPMTRFIALQLGKNHYFSHKNAYDDFGYHPIVSTEIGLKKLIEEIKLPH